MLKISDKIEVFLHQNESECGSYRGVRAKCNISLGQSLVKEQPVAWILSASEKEGHCHYCFVELELDDNIVCQRCLFARYCGENCWKADEDIHKPECHGLQELSPLVPPNSVRLFARMSQVRCQGYGKSTQNGDPRTAVDFPSEIEDLQSNTKHLEKQQFMSGLEAFHSYLKQSGTPDDLDVAMELFGKIECNSFDVIDMEQKSIGAAIYLRASMFNHSCEPNCVAVFDGNVVDIRTIAHIEANQECVISYCELLSPFRERQKKLRDQFHFVCTCNKCCQHQISESERCCEINSSESHGDMFDSGQNVESQIATGHTPTADHSQRDQQDIEDKSLEMLQQVEQLSSEGNYVDGIECCKKFLELQKPAFPQHHYIIVRTLDALIDFYVELGDNLDKAAEFGDQTIDAYRFHYPANYPSIGWQLRKVALIHSLIEDRPAERLETAIKLLTEAKEIFLVSHGEQHPLTVDTEYLLEDWTSTLEDIQNEPS